MEHAGLIHEDADIKLLILFVLRQLPGYVDSDSLAQICQSDKGVGYFDFTNCLYKLVENENIEEKVGEGFKITEKGAKNIDEVYSSLPASVREKAMEALAPVKRHIERSQMIEAKHYRTDHGLVMELAMSDSKGEIIRMLLAAGDEKSAEKLEENFRENAEIYYNKILDILSTKEVKKK